MTDPEDLLGLSSTLVSLRQPPWPEQAFPVSRVVVTGMHRSATSAVTQLLGVNGCDLGDPDGLLPADSDSPLGSFENQTIHRLNESLLEALGGAWWRPPAHDVIAGAAEDLASQIKPVWREVLRGYSHGAPVIKDPRFSILLPAWRQVLGRDTLYVVCLRDPLSVARSLLARDQLDVSAGCALWEIYTVACLRGLIGARAIFVDVDALHVDAAARLALVNQVRATLDLPATGQLKDTFDTEALGPPASTNELLETLSGYQLTLHRTLVRLPQDVVVVDDLSHLRTSAASWRILAGSPTLTRDSDLVATRLRHQLETEQAEVARLAAALRLDEESRTARLDEAAGSNELEEARTRIEQLDTDLQQARAALNDRLERENRFEQSLEQVREQLRVAQAEVVTAHRELAQERETAARCEAAERRVQILLQEAVQRADAEAATAAAVVRQHEELTAAHEGGLRRADDLQRRLNDAIQEAHQARAELQAAHELYAGAFSSRSWRWTRPLRREGRTSAPEEAD